MVERMYREYIGSTADYNSIAAYENAKNYTRSLSFYTFLRYLHAILQQCFQ